MIRAMDGVRPVAMRPRAVVMPAPKPGESVRTEPVVRRYVVGMDGIRRPVVMTPREALTRMTEPEVVPAVVAAEVVAPTPVWKMPSLRLPHVAWKRPAIALGLVATALVASGLTVEAMAPPQQVAARAASEQAERPTAAVAAAATPAPTPVQTGLQQLLDNFAAANPGKFEIVVKNLSTGETGTINPNQSMTSASLYKLFVAQRIYQQMDLGQLTAGQAAGGGSGKNINDCLTVMINVSDNTCGRALGSILGWGAQNPTLASEGYKGTNLATPQQTSASDVATLLGRLYDGTLLSANSTQKFMDLLKDQQINNRLPVGLPSGTVIAHKTGDLDGVVHDAGIVYGPKTNYLVVVMSGPWDAPGNAPALFGNLSQQLWNHFEN